MSSKRVVKVNKKGVPCPPLSSLHIKLANECQNPLNQLDVNHSHIKTSHDDNLSFHVTCCRASELDLETQEWMNLLTEDNMKEHYEACDWGWNREKKFKELIHRTAWVLLVSVDGNENEHDHVDGDDASHAKHAQDKLCAFANFRFEVGSDDQECALYCYELQLKPSMQGKGIGQSIMNILIEMSYHFKMAKVMVTCLKHNTNAYDFYTKTMNFQIDRSSPSKFNQEVCYEILCLKTSKKKLAIKK